MTVAEMKSVLDALYHEGKGSLPVYMVEWTADFGNAEAHYRVISVRESVHPTSRRVREIVVIEH